MRFDVLGSMQATARASGSTPPALGGPKQRLVLALLLAEPNSVLSVDRLVDGVWSDHPPGTARHTVQAYVSELRKEIGSQIERTGSGYAISVDRTTLDTLEFESRVSLGHALGQSEPDTAARELGAALALWRGTAFEDFPDHEGLWAERTRLAELRVTAAEDLIRAKLALGRHGEVIADLVRLTSEHPYREELRALHMIALYRSGRQADALREYQRTWSVLGDDLGIIPSPRLRRLQEQILLQDPDLEPTHETRRSVVASSRIDNPYVGLRSFQEDDEQRFFGRDELVERLVERVRDDERLTAVVGPSGSGKSSVVQAGLIPRLRREFPTIAVVRMQPGSQPFAELEAALDQVLAGRSTLGIGDRGSLRQAVAGSLADGTTRLLLVIDQFEELFTMAGDEVASRFLDSILAAIDDADGRLRVMLTLRADFYDRPLARPRFGERFSENVVNVVALSPDQLEAAATLPAQRVGVDLEPRLVGRLIADVAGQPNALPLFQFALTEVFDERTAGVLDLRTYERIGGVRRAIARRAEAMYDRLSVEEAEAAHQLFLRIATVADGIFGRRRVPASELVSLDVDVIALQRVVDVFARYRLLALDRDPASGDPTIEVAHEALLTEWARLREWIDAARADLVTQAALASAQREWIASRRSPGYLLSGARLDDYATWASATQLRLTTFERTFLDESIAARDAELDEIARRKAVERARRRRSRLGLAALFALAALVAGVLVYPLVVAHERETIVMALQSPRSEFPFDELLARGLEDAAAKLDVDAVVVEPPFVDFETELREVAAAGARLVFASYPAAQLFEEIAPEYPDTAFVVLDLDDAPSSPNVVAVSMAAEQGSFLVGAAAAMHSETNRIGYIGANSLPHIEAFRAGFEQGAAAVDPAVEVRSALIRPPAGGEPYLYGYDDIGLAKQLATSMYLDDGVDVIFVAAGVSGKGVAEAAVELSTPGRKLWVVGVDNDQSFDLPADQRDHVLTSMLKRFDVAIEVVAGRVLDGALEGPTQVTLTLADGAVGYTQSGGHLDDSTVARVDSLAADIATGRLLVDPVPAVPVADVPTDPRLPTIPVTFDGTTCAFDGDREFRVGTRVQAVLASTSTVAAGVGVWKVPDSTRVSAGAPSATFWQNTDWQRDQRGLVVTGPGETRASTLRFDEPGTWMIMCFHDYGDYAAGTFTVTP